MTHTTSQRAMPDARQPAATTDYIAEELRHYDEHLRDVRGLAAGTRQDLIRVAGWLLQQKFAGQPIDIAKLHPGDIRQFLAEQLDTHQTASTASRLAGALRSCLRYRTTCGDQVGALAAVISSSVHWKLASLPRALKPEETERLLNSLAKARLRYRPLRAGPGATLRRDRASHDQRHRLACRHGGAERHQVVAAGCPALADGNRTGAGRLSAT